MSPSPICELCFSLVSAARAALQVVRVRLRASGPRRSYKQLVCRSEPILMRGGTGEFPPLEPAFRREEYEDEYEYAQHVVLPSCAPVRPEYDFFEDAQEHE